MSTSNEKETPKYKFKDIFKLFAKSVREYKKPSILAATFISLETLTECVIPLVMSFLIDSMNDPKNTNIVGTVLMYSGILFGLACLSFILVLLLARSQQKQR